MTQTQQQPKREGVQYGDNTLFLCPDDQYEVAFAERYLQEKYPGTPAGLYTELPVDHVNASHTIILLCRPRGSTHAVKTIIEEGREQTENADPSVCWKEVVEGRPVRIKDHWQSHGKTAGRGNGLGAGLALGSVDLRGLFASLSTSLEKRDPWCLKPLQSTRMLRLGT